MQYKIFLMKSNSLNHDEISEAFGARCNLDEETFIITMRFYDYINALYRPLLMLFANK